ncbi:MAG: hypothetical protein ACRDKE_08120 [Solirubrobacterales bacterium]
MGWQPGEVDGQPGLVKQQGTRIEGLGNLQNPVHDHIVSNDGLNADYVREGTHVIVDNLSPNPYEPNPYKGGQ